jgi:hypothetical protein
MPSQQNHRSTWPDLFDEIVRTIVVSWPGSTRSLVLWLRVGYVIFAAILLVVLWRVAARASWVVDGLVAVAACLLFAYLFERSDDE